MKALDDIRHKTIGVFFGGQSPEHDISIVTGLMVVEELKKLGLKVEPVYIATSGSWCLGEELHDRTFLQNIHTRDLYPLERWSLDTRHRAPSLTLTRRPSFFTPRESKTIDIVFPTFHGAYGEDGAIQGLCEVLGVPYVGCGVEGSAIAMNKDLTKQFFRAQGVRTTDFVTCTARDCGEEWKGVKARVRESLTYPVFVKPAHAGSSIGITRVKTEEDLGPAIETALEFDTLCVIENGVSPMHDLTCCLREVGDTIEASLIQDSHFGDSDFFTYQEKYLKDGGAQLGAAEKQIIIPAQLPAEVTSAIQETSKKIFRALGLSGIGRVDFLYNPQTTELYANEINPMPGTLYHHLWKKSGVDIETLLVDLLTTALKKYSENIRKNRYFASPILSDIKGAKFSK